MHPLTRISTNRALLVLCALGFLGASSSLVSAQGSARDGTRDTVSCGAGKDRVNCGAGRDRVVADKRVKGKGRSSVDFDARRANRDGKAGPRTYFIGGTNGGVWRR